MQNPADPLFHSSDVTDPRGEKPRRPYEAPAVVEDLPLETYSLACGKATVNPCGPVTTS